MGSSTNEGQAYVVLEHLQGMDKGFRFWTSNVKDMDQTKARKEDGTMVEAYKPVWYTDSAEEAIKNVRNTILKMKYSCIITLA